MPTGVYNRRNKMSLEERRKRNRERTKAIYASSEHYRRQQKSSKLFKAYSITLEQYEEFSAAFDNKCHLCGNSCASGRRLAVDHNHKTGLIRGLLCINCNKGIGNFKDDISLLEKAIEYLKFSKETEEYIKNATHKVG